MSSRFTLFNYTVLLGASMASLLTGASLVHNIMKPDLVSHRHLCVQHVVYLYQLVCQR
jgi:Domain of unknown function (DUF4516)